MLQPTTTGGRRGVTAAKRVAVVAAAGATAGALVGGLGGRLAMLLLRVTSDPSLHGLDTDDGFTIGIVSAETTFLVVFTAVAGVIGGLVYAIVRTWLPESRRAPLFGVLTGLVGGALVIRPGGTDFTVLDPLPLAVALFVALPVAYGVVVSTLVERWLGRTRDTTSNAWLAALVVALLPAVLLGPRGAPILLLALVAVAVVTPAEADRVMSARWITWVGRATLLAVGAAAGIALVNDVVDVL
jgi:hypothetical protein